MPSTLAQKMNLKPDVVLEVTNLPENWMEQLGKELPANPVKLSSSESPAARLVFVMNREQVEELVFLLLAAFHPNAFFG